MFAYHIGVPYLHIRPISYRHTILAYHISAYHISLPYLHTILAYHIISVYHIAVSHLVLYIRTPYIHTPWQQLAPVAETGFSQRLVADKIV